MSKRTAFVTAMLAIGLVLLPLAVAQAKHTPSIEEMLNLKYVSSPQISPDGRFIAYEVQETNWKENQYIQQLWLVNVTTGKNFQLTRGKKSADGASWSPDGRWLAFVTEQEPSAIEPASPTNSEKEEGGKPAARQIWLISPEGGEAWQLTKSTTDVGQFHWSKDSKYIAFTASAPESKASKDRTEKYGAYDVFEKDYRQSRLWSVDVTKAEKNSLPQGAKQLMADASINVSDFAWSPDSTQIAFTATSNPSVAFLDDQDIYLLQLSKNLVKKVVAFPGRDFSPMFSPDGKKLAFLTWLGKPEFFYENNHIAVVEVAKVLSKAANAPSDVRDLTVKFDERPDLLGWGPDAIYFTAYQKTNVNLFRINPQTGDTRQITSPEPLVIEGVSFTRDFRTMAFVAEDASHMAELYVSSVASFLPKRLTDMTAQVKEWTLGTSEVISWKSQDGTEIEGVLYKPADYDRSRRYPLFVDIHGGPADMSQRTLAPAEYAYPVQQFLAKGALVLKPNYRGSAGYGVVFRRLNVRDLGIGEMSDIMSGIDYLIAQGMVDPNRLAAMGSSWGGYVSSFLATHTDRFKAISDGAGVSDTMTQYVNTDIAPFMQQYLRATPWDDPEIYAKTSPITTIKQAKTPVLIQHGTNDRRVPVPNAYELYRGLQDQGVESRMILYTGFGHGVNEPKAMRAVMQSNLDWFNYYIWKEPIPKDSPLLGTSELGADR